MKYNLEIFTDCQTKDSAGNHQNSHWHEFRSLHALTEFVVNLCDDISLSFNSGTSEGSRYHVWTGRRTRHDPSPSEVSITSDKKLLDFCMKKYFGSVLVNGEDNDGFGTGGGKLWMARGSLVINEGDYQEAVASMKKVAARANKAR